MLHVRADPADADDARAGMSLLKGGHSSCRGVTSLQFFHVGADAAHAHNTR